MFAGKLKQWYITIMNTVIISKSKIKKEGGVVVLPIEEYKRLTEGSVPTYYLTGKASSKADRLVSKSIREYEAGKCRTIKSLADLD